MALVRKGAHDEALVEAKAYYALLGMRQVADAMERGEGERGYPSAMRRGAETLTERSTVVYVPPLEIAGLFAQAGDADRALEWLEEAYEERSSKLVQLAVDPLWDPLRDHPRFHDLLLRIGLPR